MHGSGPLICAGTQGKDDGAGLSQSIIYTQGRRVNATLQAKEKGSMLHHIDFAVTNISRSCEFYERTLAPLGLTPAITVTNSAGRQLIGFGSLPDPEFWIRDGEPLRGRLHVAFQASSRAAVVAFHAAGLRAGGRDNGPPGLRPRYSEHWYAAFILDPDGHNIEAVCRVPEVSNP